MNSCIILNRRIRFRYFFLLIFCINLQAQPKFEVLSYTVEEGSQNTVFSILQDSRGYLWFGTQSGGLNKFNGYTFDQYKKNIEDKFSISGNEVIALMEDSQGIIWVGTRDNGLCRFDYTQDIFYRYTKDKTDINTINDNTINCFYEDSNGEIYVGTDSGLCIYDHEEDNFIRVRFVVDTTGVQENDYGQILNICKGSGNTIYIGTGQKGIIIFDTQSNKILNNFRNESGDTNSLAGNKITSLCYDSRGRLWVGTRNNGVSLLVDTIQNRFQNFRSSSNNTNSLLSNSIMNITEDSKNNIWIGTKEGINIVIPEEQDKGDPEFILYQEREICSTYPSNCTVLSFLEDENGDIWVGTLNHGVYFLTATNWFTEHPNFNQTNCDSLQFGNVTSFSSSSDGIWIGADHGLSFLNTKNQSRIDFFHKPNNRNSLCSNKISSLLIDKDSTLWVGTVKGLDIYDRINDTFIHLLEDKHIYNVVCGEKDEIWIGTDEGIFEYFKNEGKMVHHSFDKNDTTKINHPRILSLFYDKNSNIWAGTPIGLNRYNRISNSFEEISITKNRSSNTSQNFISSINESQKGILWLGTRDGIVRYNLNDNTLRRFTKKDGISGNNIQTILVGGIENIWFSTDDAITNLKISHLDENNNNPPKPKITNLDSRFGLLATDYNRNAGTKNNAGKLFFGGLNGYSSFYPTEIERNSIESRIYISEISLFNENIEVGGENSPIDKSIDLLNEVILNFELNVISFEYVALDYKNAGFIEYAYMLEGFDKDWNYVGAKREATYTNLSPGKYTFRVKAVIRDMNWGEKEATIILKILPPWYRTNTAYICYFILFVLFILGYNILVKIVAFNKNKTNNRKREQEYIIKTNQEKQNFFANIMHEFRTPLTLINGPLEKIANSADLLDEEHGYMYDLMYRNGLRLKRLIYQLLDFKKLEEKNYKLHVFHDDLVSFIHDLSMTYKVHCKEKQDQLLFISDSEEIPPCWFDKSILDNILYILLSNSIKLTLESVKITVELRFENEKAIIKVSHNGIGIPQDKIDWILNRNKNRKNSEDSQLHDTGLGLSFAKDLALLHKGSIKAENTMDGGAYTLIIPINKESYSKEELMQVDFNIDTMDIRNYMYNEDESIGDLTSYYEENEDGKYSILIVEDDIELQRFFKIQLKTFILYQAGNGKDAFKLAKKHMPDIIVSDIMMPVMDGVEFCKLIKTNQITSHIPLILLTSKSSVEERLKGIQSGADIYLPKPFSFELLETKINNLLYQYEVIHDKFARQIILGSGEILLSKVENEFIREAEKVILNNMNEPEFSIEDLGKNLGLGRSHLFRKFKSLTGHTPNEFNKIVRVKHAKELIELGKLNINQIAEECGFSSTQHFITSFKKYFKETPKRYAMRKDEPN